MFAFRHPLLAALLLCAVPGMGLGLPAPSLPELGPARAQDVAREVAAARELARRDPAEGLAAYERYLLDHPDDPVALAEAGRAALALRRYFQAARHLATALERNGGEVGTRFNLAVALQHQARFEEAIEHWRVLGEEAAAQPALASRTDWMHLWGQAAMELELEPEAVEVFRRILAADDSDSDAYLRLGRALLFQARFEEAAEVLRKAVELEPTNPGYRHLLGWALVQLGDDAAEAHLLEAVRLDPLNAEPEVLLGKFHRRRKDYASATVHYERAIEKNALAHEAWHALSRLARIQGDAERARECQAKFDEIQAEIDARDAVLRALNARIAADPGDIEAYREAARLFLELEQGENAEQWLVRLLARRPRDVEALLNLATVLARRRDFPSAVLEVRKALAVDPRHAQAHLLLGKLLASTKQLQEAIEHLEQSLQGLTPEERKEAFLALSAIHGALGNAEEAQRYAERAGD